MVIVKAAVGHKVPKRMKKRRQLDALVDTVKLPRNRKSSTSQELLDYNTDSSELEEISVAGLNARKSKWCCFCHGVVVRIGLFVVTMACLSIFFGLMWVQWHLRLEIIALREKIEAVQSSDHGSADLVLLQTQIKYVNRSLTEMKKSDGILEHLKSAIADLGVRLRKVEATTEKLNQSVNSAQTLLNTPERLKSLTDVVASLGSDLREGKKTQTAKTDELEQRLSALEGQQKEGVEEAKDKKGVLDAQFGDMLSQQVASLNETTSTGITSVNAQLGRLKGRMSALEAFTQSKESALQQEDVEKLVLDLIKEKMENMTSSPSKELIIPGEDNSNVSTDQLAQLSKKVEDMSNVIYSKTEVAEKMGLISKADYILFKETTLMNFEKINETVFEMNTEFDTLSQRLDTVDTAILNISTAVESLYHRSESDHSAQPAEPAASEVEGATSTVPPATESTTPPVLSEGGSADSEISEDISSKLQIDGIENAQDLHKAFSGQWKLNNGQVDTGYILSLLNSNSTADAERLEKFDTNSDGRFNEEELQNALELHHIQRR